MVALLDQVRSAVYRASPQPPMLFALDELAHVAPLPDLASTVAEGGSQGLVAMACLQDLSQARARWGAAADGFLTLFTHKLVLPAVADIAPPSTSAPGGCSRFGQARSGPVGKRCSTCPGLAPGAFSFLKRDRVYQIARQPLTNDRSTGRPIRSPDMNWLRVSGG